MSMLLLQPSRGHTCEQDISAVTGFFNLSNRIASATDMRPNPEYHGQAR